MNFAPEPSRTHLALVDTDPDEREVVTTWLDEGHTRDVLERGDWGRVRRFQCSGDATLQLLIYDRAQVASPVGPIAFRSEVGRRLIRTYLADALETISEHGTLANSPEFINAISIQVLPEAADIFNSWYEDTHIPEIISCPGWLGARRYRSTIERGRFLAMYDLADLTSPFESEEYDNAVRPGWDGNEHFLVGYHGFRTYKLGALAESGK